MDVIRWVTCKLHVMSSDTRVQLTAFDPNLNRFYRSSHLHRGRLNWSCVTSKRHSCSLEPWPAAGHDPGRRRPSCEPSMQAEKSTDRLTYKSHLSWSNSDIKLTALDETIPITVYMDVPGGVTCTNVSGTELSIVSEGEAAAMDLGQLRHTIQNVVGNEVLVTLIKGSTGDILWPSFDGEPLSRVLTA